MKKLILIVAIISVGCNTECSCSLESHPIDAGSSESSQIKPDLDFSNAVTTSEVIIYANE